MRVNKRNHEFSNHPEMLNVLDLLYSKSPTDYKYTVTATAQQEERFQFRLATALEVLGKSSFL